MDERFVPTVVVGRRFINLYIQKIELEYGDPYDWLRAVGVPVGPLFLTDMEIASLLAFQDMDTLQPMMVQAIRVCRWSCLVENHLIELFRRPVILNGVDPWDLAAFHVIGIQGAYERL